ncbi:UPF0565 protein C2orf69 homolog [Microtus ochrogaster]|uniref:UPF0565 protein C2orf69 homolog n=1 Tax=Microtus ochrogaster TaxID=79684 RepID=A0ABM0LHS7_MICOH|nr:UPF0565 protein C2orf69 homolog [Microtus ochrogaster]
MRLFRRRPRSPALVLLLLRPLLASSGASVPGSQPRAMSAGGGARGCCPRLQRSTVPGSDPERRNELLLLAAGDEAALEPRHHVLYFPGDVQNYHEIMTRHPENYQWENWSLENTAAILARRFPDSFIWVVKCSRMHLHKFSCYDNFVKSNMFGAPEHDPDFGAFKHLYMLLVNAFSLTQNGSLSKTRSVWDKDGKGANCESNPCSSPNGGQENERTCGNADEAAVSFAPLSLNGASFTLVGFSKGCVVLNQLLFELKEAKKDKNIDTFIRSIRTMYWLDGGHSGGSDTWVTYPEVLKEFAQTGITVHTHVTPYQVQDPMRSWIGKEHRKFVQILGDLGVQVTSQIHFAKETPSIENHFRVHEVF